MSSAKLKTVLFSLLAVSLSAAATVGNFGGKIVGKPDISPGGKWIYVESSNRSVRRVEISHAIVSYDPKVVAKDRRPRAADSLQEGATVRVSATQDDTGEWKATSVKILSTPGAVNN